MPFHPKRMLLLSEAAICASHFFLHLALFHILRHLCKRFFGICYNWNIHMNISEIDARIDINMDNLCMRRKFMQLSRNQSLKRVPSWKTADHSRWLPYWLHKRRASQISDKQRMICRNGASPHDRCHYRHLCFSHHFCKQCTGARNIHPPPARNSGRFAL